MEQVTLIKSANDPDPTDVAANPADHSTTTAKRLSDYSTLRLHQRLQLTLDISALIEGFFAWLGEHQHVDDITYVHTTENVSITLGQAKRQKAHYVLRQEHLCLGEITLTSGKRFTDQHLLTQEQGMGVLFHYLKSAISYRALEKMALRDSLTGIMNRTSLDELLPQEIARAQRYGYELSILMIDIDRFKPINDSFGHVDGDNVLRQIAQTIEKALRSSDLSFRYGGDEFLVMLPYTDLDGAHGTAKQVSSAVAKLAIISSDQRNINPRVSIGVANKHSAESCQEFIRRADFALYNAKQNGRNCIV
ncbi:MAG: diguanylate cyclase (GGDEF)-like protein [Alcanivorax sp.]|jgi:diguanylate cyclase (GGDEF)-like protein